MSNPTIEHAAPKDELDCIQIFAEVVKDFKSYSEAAKAGCKWVDQGRKKVSPADLVLYRSRLPKSPVHGQVVGVAIKKQTLIRLDMDNEGKGIHFNVIQLDDTSKKMAARLTKTVAMTEAKRTDVYREYVKALQNRSAEFIWDWWRTGVAGFADGVQVPDSQV